MSLIGQETGRIGSPLISGFGKTFMETFFQYYLLLSFVPVTELIKIFILRFQNLRKNILRGLFSVTS